MPRALSVRAALRQHACHRVLACEPWGGSIKGCAAPGAGGQPSAHSTTGAQRPTPPSAAAEELGGSN